MSQTYAALLGTDTLTASRTILNSNFDALASSFSGTAFPTTNLVIGMECLRTDENKVYRLKSTGPAVWVLTQDLNKVPAFTDSTGDAGTVTYDDTNTGYGVSTVQDAIEAEFSARNAIPDPVAMAIVFGA